MSLPRVLMDDGPSQQLLNEIGDKWSVLILAALCEEPLRFNAVQRRLGRITQKALTQSLRRLERNGLIARTVMTRSPIAVAYSVTPLGYSLKSPLAVLYGWTLDHLDEVQAARAAFDARD